MLRVQNREREHVLAVHQGCYMHGVGKLSPLKTCGKLKKNSALQLIAQTNLKTHLQMRCDI